VWSRWTIFRSHDPGRHVRPASATNGAGQIDADAHAGHLARNAIPARVFLGDLDVLRTKQDEIRRLLGYLPQDFGVYPKVTAYELLDHFAVLKGLSKPRPPREVVGRPAQKTNLFDVRTSGWAAFPAACGSASASPRRCWGDPS